MAENRVSTESIGRAGEYFAAYIFESRGIRTVRVDVYGQDLWVHTPTNRLLTVQVKASRGASVERARARGPTYRFYKSQRAEETADLFVFVALELSCLLIEASMPKDRELSASEFTPAAMNAGLARFLF